MTSTRRNPHASDENTLDAARRPRRARRVHGERAGADPRRRLFAAVSRAAEDRASPLRGPAAQRRAERSEAPDPRSEEHTSELQSRGHLVCRLLLEKKKNHTFI